LVTAFSRIFDGEPDAWKTCTVVWLSSSVVVVRRPTVVLSKAYVTLVLSGFVRVVTRPRAS
jgi:hypothetical protein